MTEERGTYDAHHVDFDRHADGVERIGDILHRLIDEPGWPLRGDVTRANGNHPNGSDDPSHGDA